jgi:hypothetical protein
MKKLLCAALLLVAVYSCKKEAATNPSSGAYLKSVLGQLRDSLSPSIFQSMDTSRAFLTDPTQTNAYTLRFAFTGKSMTEDFILLRTDSQGKILQGGIIHLAKDNSTGSSSFTGNIQLSTLTGGTLKAIAVSNGMIPRLNSSGQQVKSVTLADQKKEVTTLPASDGAEWLDPAFVTASYPDGGSDSYISLDDLLGNLGSAPSGGTSAGDSPANGSSSGGSSGASATAPSPPAPILPRLSPLDPAKNHLPTTPARGGIMTGTPLDIEAEYINNIASVDVRKLYNCFDQIPAAGATYSVKLCVDVPVNSDPSTSLNASGGISAGHTFLVVTKTGSGMSITQSFGFYPQTAPSAWDPFAALPSTIKNNSSQEINGSLAMNITTDQFNTLRTTSISLSTRPYTLDTSNCTDYALGVFNSVRSNPLKLQPYIINQPRTMASASIPPISINNSPQMLYALFSQMKSGNTFEAANIQLDLSHNLKAPVSHGECN